MSYFRFYSRKRRLFSKIPVISEKFKMFFLAGLSLTLLVIFLLFPTYTLFLRTAVLDVFAKPIEIIVKPINGAALFLSNMAKISNLQAENTRLKEENTRLQQWYQKALSLEADNKTLRNLVKLEKEDVSVFKTTRVLLDTQNRFFKTALIPLGAKDGIENLQAVLSEGVLIGRVIEPGQNVSRVLLVNDVNSRVPVKIEGTNQNAILAGNNSAFPSLIHLDRESKVEVGYRVVTSGHAGVFPAGIPVGEVINVVQDEPLVKLFADLNNLLYVQVLAQSSQPFLQSRKQGGE